MSKTSKARRDAKKKRLGSQRHRSQVSRPPVVVAQLMLDGNPFAAVAYDQGEWLLAVGDAVAAGSSDPGSMWAVIRALADRAEENGNFVSLQSATEFRAVVDRNQPPEADGNELAGKVLTMFPFPKPAVDGGYITLRVQDDPSGS